VTADPRPVSYLLDLSRLLSRSGASAPTGIDRVELAYARYLITHAPARTRFCAMHPLGVMGMIDTRAAHRFIDVLEAQWGRTTRGVPAQRLCAAIRRGLLWRRPPSTPGAIYLNVSHHHLTRPRVIQAWLRRTGARFIAMVHDLIPSDYPEYARPREPRRHRLRIDTIARFADGVIVPSDYVKGTLHTALRLSGRSFPIWTVLHGVDRPRALPGGAGADSAVVRQIGGRPFFVYVSTIEPRKNHLLLLHVWRRMVEDLGAAAPVLVLVGKRGWENENIVDLLDRSPALKAHIIECRAISDTDVQALLHHSRGVLFPSFVEGFGLPVAEALAMGVPVLCADIPVLHEVGGDVADYLDPLHGPAWRDAILDYAANGPRRTAQMQRMQQWRALSWEDSIAQALSRVELSNNTPQTVAS